jgi:hypothetical protein
MLIGEVIETDNTLLTVETSYIRMHRISIF